MSMSLEPLEKGGQIGNLRSNTYHMVKMWWKRSSRSWQYAWTWSTKTKVHNVV